MEQNNFKNTLWKLAYDSLSTAIVFILGLFVFTRLNPEFTLEDYSYDTPDITNMPLIRTRILWSFFATFLAFFLAKWSLAIIGEKLFANNDNDIQE